MAIPVTDVEVGYLYKTSNNQERITLGFNMKGQIVYAARGGNMLNEFDHRFAVSVEGFAAACSEKLVAVNQETLSDTISKTHADTVLVPSQA